MKASAKRVRRAKTADVRQQVMARANTRCEALGENCDRYARSWAPLEMDHFFGGSQRRSLERLETCWALCRMCHRNKTDNSPSRGAWLVLFIGHATRHGYLAEADLARGKLEAWRLRSAGATNPGS